MKLIFEKSVSGRKSYSLPKLDVKESQIDIPEHLVRNEAPILPELYEVDIVRHYNQLATLNHSVDRGFYPLGSCTMKYNPFLNEEVASLNGFKFIHPYQEESTVQGALELMYELQEFLKEITGMANVTLQPAAGAHGELTGMLIIKKYLQENNLGHKNEVIIPDSAHGTNPASAVMAGFEVVKVNSNNEGRVDLDHLKSLVNENTAAIMLTNPNTLGFFEKDILKISDLMHKNDALLYYDGANLNAIMGKVRPGDNGFDVVHLNLHKTFSTPHGMGGPGSGPIAVKSYLKEYLPKPVVGMKESGEYYFDYDISKSVGKMRSFYGNFLVLVKAYTYILSLGKEGLKKVSELATLNANYLKEKLSKFLNVAYPDVCKHEFVIKGTSLKDYGVSTLDFAKRLLDYGIHPPTVYFPLIVDEAMMIEPTETESKETLDEVAAIYEKIVEEARREPDKLKEAPLTLPIKRLDEVKANKELNVKFD
ncbi:glycine dehydrogenase subunit 2 [Petrotoga miotherma DSM 10691]|uniref:Probable glycine dehydrogenase (decarboxylating) subunit 2 n=2 Tax=Petrotoga TaxID=28236 RepID=A0A2K1PG77_9BACT|nr:MULTISPECIES: aminomethyl-transferring glycine dehydrogenase subunit GcvPB [Petrotoga]PNS01792.1 glycine dehydrogenase subunit 2 [Petrotoga miotherma DSM 10691]POZ89920.1 glycine dehydrogenase [Petrotoga halophila DSM 16923]